MKALSLLPQSILLMIRIIVFGLAIYALYILFLKIRPLLSNPKILKSLNPLFRLRRNKIKINQFGFNRDYILYQDHHILIANKPAGMPVQG